MPQESKFTLVWIDMEMSGLNPEKEVILEIASVITDDQLEVIETGPELIVNQPPELFEKMDSWNQKQHTKSGLWKKVLQSSLSVEDAELQTLQFLQAHLKPRSAPLCGNSVHQDRRFLNKYMKRIDEFLHYRIIDVSTIKEISNRWYKNIPHHTKKNSHRALDDILESIDELKYYRKQIFIPNPT